MWVILCTQVEQVKEDYSPKNTVRKKCFVDRPSSGIGNSSVTTPFPSLQQFSLRVNVHHTVGSSLILETPHSLPWRHGLHHQVVHLLSCQPLCSATEVWIIASMFWWCWFLISARECFFCHLNKGWFGSIKRTEAWSIQLQPQWCFVLWSDLRWGRVCFLLMRISNMQSRNASGCSSRSFS